MQFNFPQLLLMNLYFSNIYKKKKTFLISDFMKLSRKKIVFFRYTFFKALSYFYLFFLCMKSII